MNRILILDGYARQTLPMAEGFKQCRCRVSVVCYSKLDVGYLSKYPDEKILLPCGREDYAEQERLVCGLIREGRFDLVVPMTDYSAIYLAKNKDELSKYAVIAVNDPDIFALAIDKSNTMRLCEQAGIPAPKTLFSEHPLEDMERSALRYPVVIKPKTACGSIGFSIIENETHLQQAVSGYDSSNGAFFIQEYIPQDGPQYGAEAYRDRNGAYAFVLIDEKPRWFPLDGGSPTINISIHHEKMREMTVALLDAMQWHGYANIDFVMDARDGTPKIIEVNGRISAAVKLDACCGINVSEIILKDAAREPTRSLDYPDGVRTSCFLTELLWFLRSKDRFRIKPFFLNRRNTTDVIFSWRDLKPSVGFCLQSAMNFRHAMTKRKRV